MNISEDSLRLTRAVAAAVADGWLIDSGLTVSLDEADANHPKRCCPLGAFALYACGAVAIPANDLDSDTLDDVILPIGIRGNALNLAQEALGWNEADVRVFTMGFDGDKGAFLNAGYKLGQEFRQNLLPNA